MSSLLLETVRRHNSGEPVGVYSVCSAHPLVIEAAVLQALADESYLLVEATSNQVDQCGGYTGMKPTDFRELVLGIAGRHGLPEERIVLGGDHLGPNRWRGLPAEEAMTHADALVEAYVAAGFTKIHLDCSMPCADDPIPLGDDLVAERAARLALVAEKAANSARGAGQDASQGASQRKGPFLYVIGTELIDEGHTEMERSDLLAVIERRMLAEPEQWEGYYPGEEPTQRLLRRYSYSDRIRYYWSDPEIQEAEARSINFFWAPHPGRRP